MTPSILIFRNEISALGNFRGGGKLARDFAQMDAGALAMPAGEVEVAATYTKAEKSPRTRRAYKSGFRDLPGPGAPIGARSPWLPGPQRWRHSSAGRRTAQRGSAQSPACRDDPTRP